MAIIDILSAVVNNNSIELTVAPGDIIQGDVVTFSFDGLGSIYGRTDVCPVAAIVDQEIGLIENDVCIPPNLIPLSSVVSEDGRTVTLTFDRDLTVGDAGAVAGAFSVDATEAI
jgi:hypothetical protein